MTCTPCQTTHGDERDERILDLLCRLVSINTEHAEAAEGAPFGEGCARALALVLDECAARGFSVERVNDMIGWAQVGTAGPPGWVPRPPGRRSRRGRLEPRSLYGNDCRWGPVRSRRDGQQDLRRDPD